MKQKKNYRVMCSIWFLVPVLSLVRLSKPMMQICMDNGPSGTVCAAMPVKTYNGWQLLLHGNLVNAYNTTVLGMGNPGVVLLKIMIGLQVVFAVTLLSICLQEWKRKQTSKNFLWYRGILAVGYMLTAIAIYRLMTICCDYLEAKRHQSAAFTSYVRYDQYGLEVTIFLSIGVMVLFIVTWLFFRTRTVYRCVCSLWCLVPVFSLVGLMLPAVEIWVDSSLYRTYQTTEAEMEEEEEDTESLQEAVYNGFQLLISDSLVNKYKDTIIDRKNLGFIVIKIMTAFQLAFDGILVYIGLWEWRKNENPKIFLCFRGILSAGYVLTACIIYRFAMVWNEYQIDHQVSHSDLLRRSYISWDYWGVDFYVFLSIGVVVLYVITVFIYIATCKKRQ